MTTDRLSTLARRQLTDYDARSPGSLFADGTDSLTVGAAYQLQIATAGLRTLRGEAIAGYKIGCVSQAIRKQLGVAHPVFGHVFASEIRPDQAVLESADFCSLGIEGELAVTLAQDVPDPAALRDAPERFVRDVFAVIELHNYRFRGPQPWAAELIANNALHAGIVAAETKVAARPGMTFELAVAINGEQQGVARAEPYATLGELAERLAEFSIVPRQGQILLSGSPLPLYPVNPGDQIRVRCSGVAEVAAVVATG